METLDNALDFQGAADNQKLYITEEICSYWLESARWTRRLGVTMLAVVALLVGCVAYLQTLQSVHLPFSIWLYLGVAFFVVAAVGYFLVKYSRGIKTAANDSDWAGMESAFDGLSYFFSIYGFITFLFLTALAIAFIVFGGKIILTLI